MPIAGTVQITGQLAPTAPTDVFPTHDALYGLDGHRSVADKPTRNLITTARRRQGMLVYTASDGLTWQLNTGANTGTDADWTQFAAPATLAPDDASLTLAQRAFQYRALPPVAPAVVTPVVVDELSLQIASRAFSPHPMPATAAAVTPAFAVDDASLTIAQSAFQFRMPAPSAPAVAASATDVLQTQVFGA